MAKKIKNPLNTVTNNPIVKSVSKATKQQIAHAKSVYTFDSKELASNLGVSKRGKPSDIMSFLTKGSDGDAYKNYSVKELSDIYTRSRDIIRKAVKRYESTGRDLSRQINRNTKMRYDRNEYLKPLSALKSEYKSFSDYEDIVKKAMLFQIREHFAPVQNETRAVPRKLDSFVKDTIKNIESITGKMYDSKYDDGKGHIQVLKNYVGFFENIATEMGYSSTEGETALEQAINKDDDLRRFTNKVNEEMTKKGYEKRFTEDDMVKLSDIMNVNIQGEKSLSQAFTLFGNSIKDNYKKYSTSMWKSFKKSRRRKK